MIPRTFKTLAYGTALSALLAGGALAQQTPPDTTVSNTVSLTYRSGSDTAPVVELPQVASHTAEFKVDRKIDLLINTLTSEGLRTAVPGETPVVLPFFVRNLGNATEGYIVTIEDGDSIGGVGNIPAGLTQVSEAPSPGEYAIALATTYDASAFDPASAVYYTPGDAAFNISPNLPEAEGYYVLVVANIPIEAVNTEADLFTVTVATATEPDGATARTSETRSDNPMDVNIVFAEAVSTSAQTENAELDFALNGQVVADTLLRIDAPVVTATKDVTVIDENLRTSDYNCENDTGTGVVDSAEPAFLPGGCILYTIAISNSSDTQTTATNIIVNDPVPGELIIREVSNFSFTGTGTTDTQPSATGQQVTGTIATLDPDATATFTIRAEIE